MDYESLLQNDPDRPCIEDSEKEQVPRARRRTTRRCISVPASVLIGLSATTLISVLLLLLLELRSRSQSQVQDKAWSMTYPDQDMSQMGIGREHDRMWSVFEPETNFGLIYKENPDTAGMISMFHQLQCLAVFRRALQAQEAGQNISDGMTELPHAHHCLDYMYQTLRCSADDTIEWEIPTIPRTKHITGMDTVRTCRDASKLVKKACDARQVYVERGWTDGPLPKICERAEMPW